MEGEYVIEVEKLLNTIGETVLHKDLDLKVRRSEVMTLVGGSGSGKTQLLRVILGLKRPAGGSVRVMGVSWDGDPAQVREARQRMGMLFQNGACRRRLNFDHLCRLNFDQGSWAVL